VRRRWLSLYTVWPSHSQWPSEQVIFITTMRLPIPQLSCRIFWQSITSPRSVSPLQPRFGFLRLLAPPKAKIAVERKDNCEWDGHTVHKLSQRRLTADWLAHGKVTVHRCTVRSPLTGCQVTSRPSDTFSRHSKWTDTFQTALVKNPLLSFVLRHEAHHLQILLYSHWLNIRQFPKTMSACSY
jgi:hypothetical protein